MSLGIDLQLLQESDSALSTDAYMTNLKSRLKLTHEIVQKNMSDSAQRTKFFYDRNTKTPDISVGSKVLLHSDVVKPGQSPKFKKLWDNGPFLVTSKTDDGLLCKLRHCVTGKEPRTAIHVNRLCLLYTSPSPRD